MPYFVKYCSSQSTNAFNLFSGAKRPFYNHWWDLVKIWQRQLTEATSFPLFVSLILLPRRDKAFLTSLWNFKRYSSNWRNSISFMMFRWKRTYQKLLESFVLLFDFQPILTILIGFRRIRFNWPISKHCHIFWSSAPIN